MTQDEFWQHIRAARRRDPDEHAERLAARLGKLPVDEILSFGRWWHLAHVRAFTWDLWGAAYLVNGGCSDDGFAYFIDWLILQGRDPFEAAVKNPDSLAAYLKGDGEVEAECDPAFDAYAAVTGKDDFADVLAAKYPDLPPYDPPGEKWDFDDEAAMRTRYPKLFAAYAGEDD